MLLPKDYVRLKLTGERATDASDASGTLLLDVRARGWSDEILDALEIPREWLPAVHEGPEVTATVRDAVADDLGLPRGLPVAAGGGDNAAAAVGVGVVGERRMSSSIGTSGVLFAHRDAFGPDPLRPGARVLPRRAGRLPPHGRHAVGGRVAQLVARAVRRARPDFDALAAEAAEVEPGAEGLLFLPYLTGERSPHLDPAGAAAPSSA